MKKLLSALLASAMVLGMASTAFAGEIKKSTPAPTTKSGSISQSAKRQPDYNVEVDVNSDNAEYEGGPFLYKYGPEWAGESEDAGGTKAEVAVTVPEGQIIDRISVHAATKNITATVKRNQGVAIGYDSAKKRYPTSNNKEWLAPVITLKAGSGVRAYELEDWEVEVDATIGYQVKDKNGYPISGRANRTQEITFTIKNSDAAAYSRMRDLESGTTYTINKQNGSLFEIQNNITESSRVKCLDGVNLYFKGKYGYQKVNLRVSTSDIAAAQKYLGDSYADCYEFLGSPKLSAKVKCRISAGKDQYVYEYNKSTGAIKKLATTYEGDGLSFQTNRLMSYIVSDKNVNDGNVKKK